MTTIIKITLVVLLTLSGSTIKAASTQDEIDRLYNTLDSLIACQSEIIAGKEARIKIITESIGMSEPTAEGQFNINNRLYEEYMAFQFDSALHYIKKNVEMQHQLDNPDLATGSLVRMSHILAVSGLFGKAQELLDGINPEKLGVERKVEYYNQRGELNLYCSELAQFTPYFRDYIDSAQYYRLLILQIAPKDSYDYIVNLATYTCEKGDAGKAGVLLEGLLPSLSQGDRRYSIVTSTLAFFNEQMHNAEKQEYYLLLSAISDMKGAILENNSLRELANILMQRGEYKKAYTYLSQASIDAKNYGSRLRSMQVARLSPLITRAYDMQRTQSEQRTRVLLSIISIIAFLLMGTILYILSLIKKRRKANEEISRMNEELSRHNDEIQNMNNQMKESNRIKDEYIGRFLELSSNLIYRHEERMKQLNRMARDRKLEELYAELKSPKATNEGIRLFHQNFDTAFLNIYPDFIAGVNRLMAPDNRFEMSEDALKLTTELRILALLRLGIVDNQTIADILRSSITTIYTYRSKLKARAVSKDTFEDDVRRIATY